MRDLTAKFDEDPRPVDWGPDGIYFEALQRNQCARRFASIRNRWKFARITSPDSFILEDASFTKDFKTMAVIADDATHLSELYVSPVEHVRAAQTDRHDRASERLDSRLDGTGFLEEHRRRDDRRRPAQTERLRRVEKISLAGR